jgi:hypothetical protein
VDSVREVRAGLVALLLLALLAGCGGGDDSTPATRVYFLRDGKVWPVSRKVQKRDVASAVSEIRRGPTESERSQLGLVSEDAGSSRSGLAQLVYTMSQFSPNDSVELAGGRTYTRNDFEKQTPQILVESPLAFQEVETPLRVTGTANTFEATFEYELRDSAGKVVDSNFVTATSGTGTRGTFDFTTKKVDDAATLVVFERSAEDGSRTNEVEIPLRAAR